MTAGRVDQTSVAGTLRDHKARIRALEALTPNGGGGCSEWQQWSDIGDATLAIAANTAGCTPVVSDPAADITGAVWTCGEIGSSPPPGLIQGNATVVLTDPGSAAAGDCGGDFFNFYVITPPFITEEVGAPFPGVPTGFGFTYQQSTKTMIPAQLVWDATRGFGWGVMVAGTELSNDLAGTIVDGWNMARPDYPFAYQSGDTLFTGTFLYNPILFA